MFLLLIIRFHVTSFTWAAFMSGISFLCPPTLPELLCVRYCVFVFHHFYLSCFCLWYSVFVLLYPKYYGTERAFLPSVVFYLTLLPTFGASTVAILQVQLDVASTFFYQGCRASETQTRPICLFGSHSVQWKVLLHRFYLCVKALQNTISTSSRFWTHSLIATYILKSMSYPLGGSSS